MIIQYESKGGGDGESINNSRKEKIKVLQKQQYLVNISFIKTTLITLFLWGLNSF